MGTAEVNTSNQIGADFAQRHNILETPMLWAELPSIVWTYRSKAAIDSALPAKAEELDRNDPVWGLLRSMLDRIWEHVEGAVVAYVTGSPASAEVVSRTVVEGAINLVFILIDNRNGDRFSQYLSTYFNSEQREIDQWLRVTSGLTGEPQEIHQSSAFQKRTVLNQQQDMMNICLAQVELPITSKALADSWPSIAERFRLLGQEVSYRTVYAALCSQTHNDAEDLICYFIAVVSGDPKAMEKCGLDAVYFSRFMLYFAVDYYMLAACMYANRFKLSDAATIIGEGRQVIAQSLQAIAKDLDS